MNRKKIVFISIFILVLFVSIAIPTFSRFKFNNLDLEWDGTIAASFHSGNGSIDNPYLIETPAEFAYFASTLSDDDYQNKYVKLTKDLVINKGVYLEDGYLLDDNTYYIDNETGKYYSDNLKENEIGSLNIMPSLENFKGNFDGDFHTIYGLYEIGAGEVGLFKNLEGELKNLYVDNAFIYGGYITSLVTTSTDAIIKNVIFNGNVVGSDLLNSSSKEVAIDDFTLEDTLNIDIVIPTISNIPTKVLFKGTCESDESATFRLNDNTYTCEDFEIEVSDSIALETYLYELSFTNLKYEFIYDSNITSGIVGISSNTILDGVVNKGDIKGINASGIIGTAYDTNIKNSYNNGDVEGSGIIYNIISSDNYLRNVYNNGEVESSGLIKNIYESNVEIDRSFNTVLGYAIDNVENSVLTINTSYNLSTPSINSITSDDFNQLVDYSFVEDLFPGYIDDENISNGNIWVGEELPILYFDDIKNKTVQVNISNYTWDSYTTDISENIFEDGINVLLTTKDDYKPIKSVHYYLSESILTKEELDEVSWNTYEGMFNIDHGIYIVYVKYEDYNDNVYYINTDRLIVDLSKNTYIKTSDASWNNYHSPALIYVPDNMTFEVLYEDGIEKVEYLITDTVKTEAELDLVSDWNLYTNSITPLEDKYIIYLKVTDISENVSYINTDTYVKIAYQLSNPKLDNSDIFNSNITYDSSLYFDAYLDKTLISNNIVRYVSVSKALPNNTLIILKDEANVYEYKVSSSDYDVSLGSYLYAFKDFKKVGKATFQEYFNNQNYDVIEDFRVYLDFSLVSQIEDSYEVSIVAKAEKNTIIGNSISFNLYSNNSINQTISSNYNGEVRYGMDNTYNIDLNIGLNSNYINGLEITNTNLNKLYSSLSIEVIDLEGNLVPRDEYGDIRFNYDGKVYVPGKDNKTYINLGTTHNQNIGLDIITYDSKISLSKEYYIKITNYLSIDGINKQYENPSYVLIPLIYEANVSDYSFDVSIENPVISKGNNMLFNVTYDGKLTDPHIKVSLFKKKELTAYNQEYIEVDITDYINDYNETYDVGNIEMTIKNDIESNGYKFVFELYDGDTLKDSISLKTIIR